MTRVLLGVAGALAMLLVLTALRLNAVGADLAQMTDKAQQAAAQAASLRTTLRLQRKLTEDQAAIASTYLQEKTSAEKNREDLYECLATGACGLRVAATCVHGGEAGGAGSGADAGTPRLTAAAERAYPALQAGLRDQRAQIKGLQDALFLLHRSCRLVGEPE